jgi:hypothetical protein
MTVPAHQGEGRTNRATCPPPFVKQARYLSNLPRLPQRSRPIVFAAAAYVVAIALAGLACLVLALAVAPAAITAVAASTEAAQLFASAWVAQRWRWTPRSLRLVLITLLGGSAIVNAAERPV